MLPFVDHHRIGSVSPGISGSCTASAPSRYSGARRTAVLAGVSSALHIVSVSMEEKKIERRDRDQFKEIDCDIDRGREREQCGLDPARRHRQPSQNDRERK